MQNLSVLTNYRQQNIFLCFQKIIQQHTPLAAVSKSWYSLEGRHSKERGLVNPKCAAVLLWNLGSLVAAKRFKIQKQYKPYHRIILGHETMACAACPCATWQWFNIKMLFYQYRKSHCGDKRILRPSYLHNGISYTGKMASLYWIRAQCITLVRTRSIRRVCWVM